MLDFVGDARRAGYSESGCALEILLGDCPRVCFHLGAAGCFPWTSSSLLAKMVLVSFKFSR